MAVLALIAGCGTDTAASPSAAPSPKQERAHMIQVAKADCMKGKGFRYVPYVARPEISEQDMKTFDYAAAKAERSKYGFRIFSSFVYPDKSPDDEADPNVAIIVDLSPAQLGAYKRAGESCDTQAIRQVTGKNVKSYEDWATQASEMVHRLWKRELDGDPKLVELASAMADCLTGKGYRVTSTKPVAMSEWAAQMVQSELQGGRKTMTPNGEGPVFKPINISPDEARRYLDKEIKVALDDLECGKQFYPVIVPKSNEVEQRVNEEFGI
ncbi:hypothetical protein Misp02_45820 [Microtetraspora sp. NBRC 16547]|nr:hypothetical protein Misp02_45820 [Microtetraspora sp. NBRC 16547]